MFIYEPMYFKKYKNRVEKCTNLHQSKQQIIIIKKYKIYNRKIITRRLELSGSIPYFCRLGMV